MKIEIEWHKKKDALGVWCYELRTTKGTVLFRIELNAPIDGWIISGMGESYIGRLWGYSKVSHAKRVVEKFLGVQK